MLGVPLCDGVVEVAVEAVVEVTGLDPDDHVAYSVVLSDVNPTKHHKVNDYHKAKKRISGIIWYDENFSYLVVGEIAV